MSKQRPDADKLANELLGASAFFRPTPQAAAPEPNTPPVAAPSAESMSIPEPFTQPDVTTSQRHDATTSAASRASVSEGFDINRPTTSRDSLRLSIDETKALDDLRQSLKWDYDLSISKNDICRVALHALLEEVRAKGEKSAAITRLKRKQPNR